MLDIAPYINENLILFLNSEKQKDALESMIQAAVDQKKIGDASDFLSKVENREKIVSTGVGFGVAIPHAKMQGYEDFFIVIGILKNPIDWKAIDGHPVRIIFLIGGPDDKQNEYLQILSTVTHLVKEEDFRKKLLTLNSSQAILSFLNSSKG
ncbi:MAG: PTS sugar transporter subunit IIA [Parachlamydiaceae bacterium]